MIRRFPRSKSLDYMTCFLFRRDLLLDYFEDNPGRFEQAIRDYRAESYSHHYARRMEIVEALYWRHAFGVASIRCPNCGEYTINAWDIGEREDALYPNRDLVWYCLPCMKADALRDKP